MLPFFLAPVFTVTLYATPTFKQQNTLNIHVPLDNKRSARGKQNIDNPDFSSQRTNKHLQQDRSETQISDNHLNVKATYC